MSKELKRLISFILSVVMTVSCMSVMYVQEVFADDVPTIYIVGDSTSCHYVETADANYYYKRVGFGDKIAGYLKEGSAEVVNLALSGRSSKSFTTEDNYQTLINNIGEGDILLIAFGHNDEKVEDAELGTTPNGDKETEGSFKNSLYVNYIKMAQDKGATPVLCSPIVRLPSGTAWNDSALHKVNGGDYAADARNLAQELGIGFIDLTELTKAKYDEVGFENAEKYHAASTEGSVDRTHLNNYGAAMVAYLIATNAGDTVLDQYMAENPVEPTEEEYLEVNPDYVAPPEGDLTGDQLISEIWTTTSPWYGSAFGNIGGTPAASANYGISEDGDSVRVYNLGNKGKISSTVDGMVLYYQPVAANENFQISADAYINSIDTSDNGDQVGFGAIMADKILVDNRYDNYNMENYVAASPINLVKGPAGGFAKTSTYTTDEDGTKTLLSSRIKTGPALTDIPQAGDTIHVGIVKNGNMYTVTYGDCVSTYTLTNEQMEGWMYVGLFASRNADVTFSNIIYNNEVVEGEVPTEGTTEGATETTTEGQPGDSFTWWADDSAVDGKLDIKTYTVNGADIMLHNANASAGIKEGVAVGDKEYNSYIIGKESTGGYIEFKAAADGWVTFYLYLSGKSYNLINETTNESVVVSDEIYTAAVTAGATYKLTTEGTNSFGIAGVSFTKKEPAIVTANITVNSAEGNVIADGSKLIFTNDSTGEVTEITLNAEETTYNVELSKGFTYTVTFEGTDTMIIGNNPDATASVTTADVVNALDIILVDALPQKVTGTVYGPAGAKTTIQFGDNAPINVDILESGAGTYVTELKPGTYNVAVGTIEGYSASSLSTKPLVVVNNGDENYKNVLYTKPVDSVTGYDVYVDRTGNYYSDKDNVYTNLTDAMAAIDASGLKGSKNQRFVVHVAPGFYEEQFFVNADFVSIIADSDGDGVVDGDVIVSWYYGIDYMYYSIDPATGFYSEEYAVDKHTKTTCTQKWGATMIVSGSNFYSEGITYQNTFNLELRAAELADGVENDGTNSDNNTSYDRTQENANVRLTTATERAAALVIDGQQAEFYNCQFLGSQDTVYTGNYNHYFNNCLLAGETDYIFGNGGTTIFDNCELQWIDYHYEGNTSEKAGYIAVPRGTYIFRDCEITSSGLGLDVTEGVPVVTEGYYGRPWGTTASVIFMNCNTNGLILADGWKDMSGVNPEQVAFKEYNNKAADGTVFYSNLTVNNPTAPDGTSRILSDAEAEELRAENDWKIFSTWLPSSHVEYVGNPNIYKFDFTTGNVTSPVKDENGVADLTHNGMKYHGTTYGATMGNGGTMTVYAGSDAQSMDIGINSSYNQNKGTLELYKNDVLVSGGAIEFANESDNEMKTFTVTDVKAGDIFTIKYAGTDTFYCGNVTVSSFDGTLTTAPVYNIYNFNFTRGMSNPLKDDNGVAEVVHEGFNYHGAQYGFNAGRNALVKFTVATAGEASINIDSSYQENNEVVTLKNAEGTVLGSVSLVEITSDVIKANLEPGEYTIEYVIPEDAIRPDGTALSAFYSKGLTITMSEEGTLAGPAVVVPTNTYEFDFAALNDGVSIDAIPETVMDKTGAVPMAISGDVNRHTGGHGVAAKNGSSFSFTLVEAGTTTIEMPYTYLGSTSGTIDVTNAMGEKVGSYTLTATITSPIVISLGELPAGTYAITNNSGKDLYVPTINITTTGVLGEPGAVPVINTYAFDFAAAATGHTQEEVATGDVYDKNNTAVVTLGNNVKYHGTTYGFVVSEGAEISFTLSTGGNTTITISSSYKDNAGSVSLYKDDVLIGSTGELINIMDGTISGNLEAGTYTLKYSATGSFYTAGITIVTEGAVSGPAVVVPTKTYSYDFTQAATNIISGSEKNSAVGNELAKITLDATASGAKFRAAGSGNGYQIATNSVIGFTLAGDESNVNITMNSSYNAADTVINIRKSGTEKVLATINVDNGTKGEISADFVGGAGDYEIVFANSANQYISALSITVPEETMNIGARPDIRGNVNADANVDILDAVAVLKNVGSEITNEATLNSDYDLDGEITNKDAAAILKAKYAA